MGKSGKLRHGGFEAVNPQSQGWSQESWTRNAWGQASRGYARPGEGSGGELGVCWGSAGRSSLESKGGGASWTPLNLLAISSGGAGMCSGKFMVSTRSEKGSKIQTGTKSIAGNRSQQD